MHKHSLIQCLPIWVGLILCQNLFATSFDALPVLPLSDSLLFQEISREQIGFIEDKDNELLLDLLEVQNFSPLESRNLLEIAQQNFNYWAVIKLVNTSKYNKTWWLDVPGNYVNAWIERANGQMETAATGNLLKQKDKSIKGLFRNFNYIPIQLKAGEKITLKLNIKTSPFFPIYKNTISVGQPLYFENFQNERMSNVVYYDGMYSALMIMFCLYCLTYFLFTKEIFAFWAACYALCLICYFYQFNSTWYRFGLSPVFIQQFGIAIMNFSLLFDFLFTRKFINLRELFPFWEKAYLKIIYFLIGFIGFHALFYFLSQHYFFALLLILLVHTILYIPKLIVGVKLLTLKKPLTSIFAVGLIVCHVLLFTNNFQLTDLSNQLLKIGVSFYILSILLSLSFRAAVSQKQKIQAEAARVLETVKLEELQKLDGFKSKFFANVSHELRTPLTLILGPINSVLKNEQLGNRDFTLLKRAQQSGQELLKLVNSILDFSKMETTKIPIQKKPVALFKLTRRIVASFESYAQQKEIQFTFNYEAEKNLVLLLDEEKLVIVLNNLLSNALKFTPKKGRIAITLTDEEKQIKYVVSDTGNGIHRDDLPYIFNRFYQSIQPNTITAGGTGIGLALSKEYINLLEGHITAESQLGVGSTFTFVLPRKEVLGSLLIKDTKEKEAVISIPATQSTEKALNKKALTLLIVEDNYSLRNYLLTILAPYYNIIAAENGKIALDILQNNLEEKQSNSTFPNLVISDIMMPEMDGFQLLETVKTVASLKHLPMIMLTAKAGIDSKLKALRIGVDDYLLKPFDEEELLVRIENLLNNVTARLSYLETEQTTPIQEATKLSQEAVLWLEQVENLVKEKIGNPLFTIPVMASDLAMSERSLQRQLKKITGFTPNQYVQEIKLDKARQLLETKKFDTIAKVAYAVGFSDTKNFSRRFKQRYGKAPSAY